VSAEVQALTPTTDQRARSRLSWKERLARNARAPTAPQPSIQLDGVPDAFAVFLGLQAV
jgi:hypothetical protein